MKKSKLIESKSSFLEVENNTSESDDYEDDDVDVDSHKESKEDSNNKDEDYIDMDDNKNSMNDSEINLLQTNFKTQDNKLKKKDLVYSKPKENRDVKDYQKAKIYRNTQMEKLQKSHTFRQAERENINETFNKGRSALGKNNADEFVSFLGYIRDASFRASRIVSKKEEKRLEKLIDGDYTGGKKALTAKPSREVLNAKEDDIKKDEKNKKDQYVPTSNIKYT